MSQEVIEVTEREVEVVEIIERGPAGPAGTGLETLTTQGDTLYQGVSSGQRLPIGTAGQILKVNSGATAPEWGEAPATGVTSVGVTGSDGIEVDSGSPVTGSGTIALGVNAATLRNHINVADGAEVNVQSNWTEADSGSDAFILNKPTLGTAAAQDANQDLNTTSHVQFESVKTKILHAEESTSIAVQSAISFDDIYSEDIEATTRANLGLGSAATSDTDDFVGIIDHPDNSNLSEVVSAKPLVFEKPTLFSEWVSTSKIAAGLVGGDAAKVLGNQDPTDIDFYASEAGAPVINFATLSAKTGLSIAESTQVYVGGSYQTFYPRAATRTNLGLGATDNVTFGSIQNTPIGSTTPNAGTFTTLAANNGTLTASAPALDISQTWNDSGTKFTAFKLNATNTASNVESILADFQVDGASVFSINDNGVGINGGTWATFSETFGSAVLMGGVWYVNNGVGLNVAAHRGPLSCVVQLGANQSIGWSTSNQPANANSDLRFHREGAGILGQRNGTNAQEFRLYNTWTSASNYEALAVKWAANVVSIGPTAGGSGGTVRELHISGLPSSDVGTGILWNDNGTVKVGT